MSSEIPVLATHQNWQYAKLAKKLDQVGSLRKESDGTRIDVDKGHIIDLIYRSLNDFIRVVSLVDSILLIEKNNQDSIRRSFHHAVYDLSLEVADAAEKVSKKAFSLITTSSSEQIRAMDGGYAEGRLKSKIISVDIENVNKGLFHYIVSSYEVVFRDFLRTNPDVLDELKAHVREIATEKCKSDSGMAHEREWVQEIVECTEQIVVDILGTLALGTSAIMSLVDLGLSESDPSFSLRVHSCMNVLKDLKVKESKRKKLNARVLELSRLNFKAQKDEILESVGVEIANKECKALEGRKLVDLFSWSELDEGSAELVKYAISSGDETFHMPNIGVRHILAGSVSAAQDDVTGKKVFPYLEKYLSSKQHRIAPRNATVHSKNGFDVSSFEKLRSFIEINAKNTNAVKFAKAAAEDPSQLEKIKRLDLSSRGIKEVPEELGMLQSLTTLDLSSNEIETLPVGVMEKLKNLKVLVLAGNQIKSFPKILEKMETLNRVDILENPLSEVPFSMEGKVWDLPYQAQWVENLPDN